MITKNEEYTIKVGSEELKLLIGLVDEADDKMRELNSLGATKEMKEKQQRLYDLYIYLLYIPDEQ